MTKKDIMLFMKLIIFTDGGSRGNPGPGASAFVVKQSDKVIFEKGEYDPHTTNNKAEYKAVLMAMEWLSQNHLDVNNVSFFLDSELVVKQLNGIYKIKDTDLAVFASKIKDIAHRLSLEISFTHVRRELNKEADALVNKTLDISLQHV